MEVQQRRCCRCREEKRGHAQWPEVGATKRPRRKGDAEEDRGATGTAAAADGDGRRRTHMQWRWLQEKDADAQRRRQGGVGRAQRP
ncbi:DUF3482 domain-containing protein [Sesbania bispinosa]|nr:DUF3482 domain-containing protein [Sesbania bispinosa]